MILFNIYSWLLCHNFYWIIKQMSLKKSELKELEKERDRFKLIMEKTLTTVNAKRMKKF